MARGLYVDPPAGRVALIEWSETWLARPGKRVASMARDRQGIAAFTPLIGSVYLSGLTPGLIQGAIDARSKVTAPATRLSSPRHRTPSWFQARPNVSMFY